MLALSDAQAMEAGGEAGDAGIEIAIGDRAIRRPVGLGKEFERHPVAQPLGHAREEGADIGVERLALHQPTLVAGRWGIRAEPPGDLVHPITTQAVSVLLEASHAKRPAKRDGTA